MNDMFENLKEIKKQLKKDVAENKNIKVQIIDKQKKLQDDFFQYMQSAGIKKISQQ